MSISTPRQRGYQRPSFGKPTSSNSPNLLQSASTAMNRKASYNALMGAPQTPATKVSEDLEVGDTVNVPGDMHGTVRFVGSVQGKQGRFVGVELSRDYAARGKNDGDVDGVQYFTTSIPGSGIFLPIHRAERRDSPALSLDSFPATPNTPSQRTSKARPAVKGRTPPTPALPSFSQSVGPGARPSSPQFKPKSRPSLPRPESPFRKQPNLQPTPARNFSASQRASVAGASPAASRTPKLGASSRAAPPPRPYSRTSSRLGQRNDNIPEESTTAGRRGVPSFSHPLRSPSRLNRSSDENRVQQLEEQIAEKDRQLHEQATTLTEMESSLKEIQSLMPDDRPRSGRKNSGMNQDDSTDVARLKQALKEKNEKIQSLVAEFDAHRVDFRSTIDTLELASGETERVYEGKLADLTAELDELREMSHTREEVESVATQLKALEELVAELEEGLEDARRGEAEARGEVEFLRGEVERGRSELRREREKAATSSLHDSGTGASAKDRDALEMKDDEIRGLKAIIHSLSSGGAGTSESPHVRQARDALEGRNAASGGTPTRKITNKSSNGHRTVPIPSFDGAQAKNSGADSSLWCEACEKPGHDILDCKMFGKTHKASRVRESDVGAGGGAPSSPFVESPIEKESSAAQAAAGEVDADKWCALCEKDGHLAFDCPEEQY